MTRYLSLRRMHAWKCFDFICTQMIFSKPTPAEWLRILLQNVLLNIQLKWLASPWNESNQLTAQVLFQQLLRFKSRFKQLPKILIWINSWLKRINTHQFINKSWVVTKSAGNKGLGSLRAVHTRADSGQGWKVRVRCCMLGKGMCGRARSNGGQI